MTQTSRIHHGIQIEAIESLRGVAALMVLVYHLAELVKLPLPASLGFVPQFFGFGVPLFYTLSGFVLAYGYADRLDSRSQVLSFYTRRLFRIVPLFYTMLLLWLVANWWVWNQTFSLRTITLNITLLFGLIPGQHESIVWAGWSIGIEMLFYLLFPIVSVLVRDARFAVIAFTIACMLSGAVQAALRAAEVGSYVYMNLLTHLPFFMAGVLTYRIWQYSGFIRHRAGWLLLSAAMVLMMLLTRDGVYSWLIDWFGGASPMHAWALAFAMVVLASCITSNPILEHGPLRHLGQISFSVYLVHPMLMVALIKADLVAWVTSLSPHRGLAFILGASITIALVWAVSSLTFRFIEVPGIALGRALANKIEKRNP